MSKVRSSRTSKTRKVNRSLVVPYSREESNIFDKILRPRLSIALYSEIFSEWITVDDVLADTGADISLLPKSLGILLVGDIRKGRKYRMTGVIAGSVRYFYLHRIKLKLGPRRFGADFAIAAGDDVPPTLGRISALDKMNIEYDNGRRLVISW